MAPASYRTNGRGRDAIFSSIFRPAPDPYRVHGSLNAKCLYCRTPEVHATGQYIGNRKERDMGLFAGP